MIYTTEEIAKLIKLAYNEHGFKCEGLNDIAATVAIRRVFFADPAMMILFIGIKCVSMTVPPTVSYERSGIFVDAALVWDAKGDHYTPGEVYCTWEGLDGQAAQLVSRAAIHFTNKEEREKPIKALVILEQEEELLRRCPVGEVNRLITILNHVKETYDAGLS